MKEKRCPTTREVSILTPRNGGSPRSRLSGRVDHVRSRAKELNSRIQTGLKRGQLETAQQLLQDADFDALDKFAYLLQPSTVDLLMSSLRFSTDHEIREFQKFLRGDPCEWPRVVAFAREWNAKWARPQDRADLKGYSWHAEVDAAVKNFLKVDNPKRGSGDVPVEFARRSTSWHRKPIEWVTRSTTSGDELRLKVRSGLKKGTKSRPAVLELSKLRFASTREAKEAAADLAEEVYGFAIQNPEIKVSIAAPHDPEFHTCLSRYFELPPIKGEGKARSPREKVEQQLKLAWRAGVISFDEPGVPWQPVFPRKGEVAERGKGFASLCELANVLFVQQPERVERLVERLCREYEKAKEDGLIVDFGRSLQALCWGLEERQRSRECSPDQIAVVAKLQKRLEAQADRFTAANERNKESNPERQ